MKSGIDYSNSNYSQNFGFCKVFCAITEYEIVEIARKLYDRWYSMSICEAFSTSFKKIAESRKSAFSMLPITGSTIANHDFLKKLVFLRIRPYGGQIGITS